MYIITESQKLQYELSNVIKLFFPAEDTVWITDSCDLPTGETAIIPTVTDTTCSLKIAVNGEDVYKRQGDSCGTRSGGC